MPMINSPEAAIIAAIPPALMREPYRIPFEAGSIESETRLEDRKRDIGLPMLFMGY
mgnify:CR=1 FL=1